jgi:hypothetical protein
MLLLLAMGLVGCTTPQGAQGGSGTFVSIVGTPFLVALKIPVCVTTVAIGGPIAAASMVAQPSAEEITLAHDPDPERHLRRTINDGLVENCGPPYVLTP